MFMVKKKQAKQIRHDSPDACVETLLTLNPDPHPALLSALCKYLDSVPDTGQGARYAVMFCARAKDPSKESLDKFMNQMKESEYKDSTKKYAYGILKRMYKLGELEWPYRSSDAPKVRERTVFAPMLDPAVVIEMIQAVKEQKVPARYGLYLAISTTYGCRRAELAQLAKTDIDLKTAQLYIETKKAGRERYHLIPDPIMPILKRGSRTLHPVSTKTLDRIWERLEAAIAFPHVSGVGWHSIRRSLDRLLLEAGVPQISVMDFLRWKRSERDMPLRYAQGSLISRQSVQTSNVMSMYNKEADEAIFKLHPFLKAWED
jgi:integrase